MALDSQPSIYYSGSFGDWGVALGYTATLENLAGFQIEAARAGDITDPRNFSAATEVVIGYNLFWESGAAIGVSRGVGAGTVGIRLREVSQTARYGRIVSGLHLEPQSLPDVNFNDPGELISTIVDGIDFSSLDQYIIGEGGKSIHDLAMSTFEIDLGYQRNFSITGAQQLRAGLIVENLLQRKLIRPLPRKLGIGVGYKPIDWIGIGFDIWRVAGYPGFDFALGGELQSPWKHSLLGAALRGGLGRIDTVGTFSVGWSLVIGHLYCEYTLQKRFRDQLLDQATHIFASTIRF